MGRFDFLRMIKRSKSNELRACPQCLSLKIKKFRDSTSGWLSPQRYVCPDCNYFGYGYIVLDDSEYLEQIEKEMNG